MAKKTSGEVSNKPAKKVPSKRPMSLQEAFSIVRKSDAEIKSIYSTRSENEINIQAALEKSAFKYYATMIAAIMSSGLGLAFATDFAPFIAAGIIPSFLIILNGDNEKFLRMMQPIKSRKLQAEYNIHEQLREFHEETMAEQTAEVLMKAKKAIKIVNASLKEYGQEMYYNSTRGEEGFAFTKPEIVDEFELAFLRASKNAVQSELEEFKAELKAIESKQAA